MMRNMTMRTTDDTLTAGGLPDPLFAAAPAAVPSRLAVVARRLGRLFGALGGLGIAVLALYPVAVVLALAASILVFASKHGPI